MSYVVHDRATREAAVIDSVLDFDPAAGRTSFGSADAIIDYVKAENLSVAWLLKTHAYADHLSAAPYLKGKPGGTLAIGREIICVQNVFEKIFNEGTHFAGDGSEFDRLFEDGDRFQIGRLEAVALQLCIALFAGTLFGAGLAFSGMADPHRVRGFLDVFGT